MKKIFILPAIIVLGIFAFRTSKKIKDTTNKNSLTINYKPVSVIELFTSEGCSSCPPADRLLPELARLDSPIFALSFHVDYWDHLGWKDPFSSQTFSNRQREYARYLKLQSLYTPQLVINGKYEVVGSNRIKAESTIRKSLLQNADVLVSFSEIKINRADIEISYSLEGKWKETSLVAALVQKEISMNIKSGENQGSKLTHYNVVRAFSKIASKEKGIIHFEKIKGLNDDQWQVIVFTQKNDNLLITGAGLFDPLSR